MKKILVFVVSFLCMNFSMKACDACGCSAGAGGIGLYTNYKSNFINLGWQYSSFHAIGNDAQSQDQFHILDLSGRYYLSNRWKVQGHLPYRINSRQDDINQSVRGVSDVRLLIGYSVLQDRQWGRMSVFAELNAGVKIPTGNYNPNIHDENLPENFNIGQGNVSAIIQPNIVLSGEQGGVIFSANAILNSASTDDYQFGHQYSMSCNYYREIPLRKENKLVPAVGAFAEWSVQDEHANGAQVYRTGGEGTFGAISMTFRTSKYLIGAGYMAPIFGTYSEGEVEARSRFSLQLSIFI